jgi:hypothetical protein
VDKLEVSGQDKTTKVGKTWTIETATGFKLADNTTTKVELVGGKILISAPTEVTIRCGESTQIVLSPNSVTISAATVKLAGNTGNVLELAGEKADPDGSDRDGHHRSDGGEDQWLRARVDPEEFMRGARSPRSGGSFWPVK